MRVVNIIHYPIDYSLWEDDEEQPVIRWLTPSGKYCAIWNGSWAQLWGDEIRKYNSTIEYEVWRPDLRADKIYTFIFPTGLVYKLFPAKWINYLNGLKPAKVAYSAILTSQLLELAKTRKDLVVHINASYRHHDALILQQIYRKIPVVAQFYTNPLQDESSGTNNPFKWLHRFLIKTTLYNFYSKLKYIIPSTQDNTNTELQQKYGIQILKRSVANFGIDTAKWKSNTSRSEARSVLGIEDSDFVFFHSSRLVPEKQIDKLILVLSKLNNCNYKIYISGNGSDSYTSYLKSLIVKLKLESNVYLIGFVLEEKLRLYYLAANVFINCSKSEAGPLSTLIACYYQIPVITTDSGLVYDFLCESQCGSIISKNDSSLWGEAIIAAVNGTKIRVPSPELVADFVDWKKISEYYIQSYNSVIGNFNNHI